VNALLDAWLVTGRRPYVEKAESLIRRSVHPDDDVAFRDLLNVEKRWSYTVFLAVLARYLAVKAEAGELDFMYAYVQSSLVRYAMWMLDNEVPYFDHPEKLEFPTEAWAAQEFRKANVLRLAAGHVDEPLRSAFLRRGHELAERAWKDLLGFETAATARAVAIVLVEGARDAYFREHPVEVEPRPSASYDFGVPEEFQPQKLRALRQLKTVRGLARSLIGLADVRNWRNLLL
jgi:hypothetical protein